MLQITQFVLRTLWVGTLTNGFAIPVLLTAGFILSRLGQNIFNLGTVTPDDPFPDYPYPQ